MRIFSSYGHDENTAVALRLKSDLERRAHEVWFDVDRLKPGADWERALSGDRSRFGEGWGGRVSRSACWRRRSPAACGSASCLGSMPWMALPWWAWWVVACGSAGWDVRAGTAGAARGSYGCAEGGVTFAEYSDRQHCPAHGAPRAKSAPSTAEPCHHILQEFQGLYCLTWHRENRRGDRPVESCWRRFRRPCRPLRLAATRTPAVPTSF